MICNACCRMKTKYPQLFTGKISSVELMQSRGSDKDIACILCVGRQLQLESFELEVCLFCRPTKLLTSLTLLSEAFPFCRGRTWGRGQGLSSRFSCSSGTCAVTHDTLNTWVSQGQVSLP